MRRYTIHGVSEWHAGELIHVASAACPASEANAKRRPEDFPPGGALFERAAGG